MLKKRKFEHLSNAIIIQKEAKDRGSNNVNDPVGGKKPNHRANGLSGSDWTRFSISIWSDIRFTPEERQLRYPAMFPTMLVERLIRCFTTNSDRVILDSFLGSGSAIVAAKSLCRSGIGFDVYDDFVELANERLRQQHDYY